MAIPIPSPESLAHRARIAALVSSLRPTHFKVPLTRLPAHRIPTLWTLYRGIIRDAPTEVIRSRMREFFRARKSMRAQGDVCRELRKAHKWWDIFRKARAGDQHFQAVCARYSRMLEGARMQRIVDRAYGEQLAWYEKMRTRPIVTGGYLRPTIFNKPLPRLVPQPAHVTGMITARRKARDRRLARQDILREQMGFLTAEAKFEEALAHSAAQPTERFFTADITAWRKPIKEAIDTISESFEREKARQREPYPPEMLAAVKEARREKIRNKTRERERERHGEMTTRLLKRIRQGPPAHVLAQMSEEQRRLDRIARSASEVGYVAQVKRQLGYKFRDPEAWKVELGKPENQEMLDRMAAEIEEVNAKRRGALDDVVDG